MPRKPLKRKTTKKGSDPETSQACEYCGSKDGVSVRTDPYAHELYDDETLHAMCDDVRTRKGDGRMNGHTS